MLFLFLLQTQFAGLQPGIELRTERVDRAALIVNVAMNWHALALFPSLHGTDVPFYITGNFFPGIRADRRGLVGRLWRWDWRGILHIPLFLAVADGAEWCWILIAGQPKRKSCRIKRQP